MRQTKRSSSDLWIFLYILLQLPFSLCVENCSEVNGNLLHDFYGNIYTNYDVQQVNNARGEMMAVKRRRSAQAKEYITSGHFVGRLVEILFYTPSRPLHCI